MNELRLCHPEAEQSQGRDKAEVGKMNSNTEDWQQKLRRQAD